MEEVIKREEKRNKKAAKEEAFVRMHEKRSSKSRARKAVETK